MLNRTKAPETVEELVSAVNALHAEALDLIRAFFASSPAGASTVSSAMVDSTVNSKAAPLAAVESVSDASDVNGSKPGYWPRCALYQLAQDAMAVFHVEHGRRPNWRELLVAMPAHDSDYRPVSPRLDGKVVRWLNWSGELQETTLKAFKNNLSKLRIPV